MGARRAVTNKMAAAYRSGTTAEKAAMLGQLCELTGKNREHARARSERPKRLGLSAGGHGALRCTWLGQRLSGTGRPGERDQSASASPPGDA